MSSTAFNKRPWIIRLMRNVISANDDSCWLWRGYCDRDGYPLLRVDDYPQRVSHLMLLLDDREVAPGMHACHTCDNPGCVNPTHLYVGTPQQNVDDWSARQREARPRSQPGSSHPGAKLTEADVIRIRELAGTVTQRELGEQFGVSPSVIGGIVRREKWTHV